MERRGENEMSEETIECLKCTTDTCPSGLKIHAYAQGELSADENAAVEARVAQCQGCRERLERAQAGFSMMPQANRNNMLAAIQTAVDPEEIPTPVREAFGMPTAQTSRNGQSSWLHRLSGWFMEAPVSRFGMVGAMVAIIALALPRIWEMDQERSRQDRPELRMKGGAVLEVLQVRGKVLARAEQGASFRSGDTLVYQVTLPQAGHLMVVGQEKTGKIYASYPANGNSTAANKGADQRLQDSVVLDDSTGEEWLYLVHCPTPFRVETIIAGSNKNRVGTPKDCTQSAFKMMKVP